MAEAKIDIILSNGAKAGNTLKELGKDANRLNKEIKDLKPGSQEFIDKSKDLQQVNGRLKEVKDQINGTTKASNSLKDSFTKFIPFSGEFQAIGEKITGTTSSVGGLTKNFGLLRGAIISTGIGALIVLLGSLISYFTSTQDGMDKVTAVTRPLSAILERLKGVLQELGEKVFKTFTEAINNPKQAIEDLGNSIKNIFLNQLKGLLLIGPAIKKILSGDISGGFKDLGNAAIQATTGITNGIDKIKDGAESLADFVSEAVAQGARLDELQKQIERAEINQIKRSKELDLIIKQQKFIVEDQTRSFDERRAAAEKALGAQETLLNSELALIDQKIEKMRLEQSLNDTSRAQEKELAELEAQRLEKEAQITEQRIEFRNKVNDINKAQSAEELATQKNLQTLRLEALDDGLAKEIELINQDTQQKLEAIKGTEEQITEQALLLENQRQQRIREAREKNMMDQLAVKMEQQELDLATDLNHLNEQFLQQEITNDEYALRNEELALGYQARKMAMIRAAHGEESAEYQKAKAEYIALQQAASDRAVEIKKQELADQAAVIQGSLGTFGNFYGALAGMQKQGTEQWKTFATTQASISAIQSALNAYQSTAAIPVVGPALAPIAAAAALAAGLQRVREIQKTKVEAPVAKKEKGGLLRGKRHSQGGIPIEAEDGEFIFSRKAVQGIGVDELNRVNNYFTRKMEIGGPVNPFQDRAPIASSSASSAASSPFTINNDALIEEVRGLRSELANWPRVLKVQNVVTETEDALKTVNVIRDAANV